MVLDARIELNHIVELTVPQIVRHTLEYERAHGHLHLGRHPFGLPIVAAPSGDVMTPEAAAALSSAAAADGPPLFDAA